MADKPKFDPSKPFDVAAASKPKFDPSKSFSAGPMAIQEDPTILQEMHPAFSSVDRAKVKNFANSDESAIGYLKQQYPGMEITNRNGQIVARGQGEKEYRVLDPDTGFFSNPLEMLRDLGDVGYDIGAGVGTSAATAAGGLFGALPGAAIGGAVSSAGLEALRQKAGNWAGIDQQVDGGDVAFAGGLGALSPLLLGTGATGTQAVLKSQGKNLAALNPFAGFKGALPVDDAAEAVLKSQRGLPGIGYDAFKSKLAPKVGAAVSGTSESAIRGLSDNYDDFLRIENDPLGRVKFATETAQEAGSKIRAEKQRLWSAYDGAVKSVPKETMVDATPAASVFETAIQQANELGDEKLAKRLQDEYFDLFGKPVTDGIMNAAETAKLIPVRKAVHLDRRLSDLAGLDQVKPGNIKGGVGNRFANESFEDKAVMMAAGDAKRGLTPSLEAVLPEDALAHRAAYGEVTNLERSIKPMLKSTDATLSTLRNLGSNARVGRQQNFAEIDRRFGTDLIKRAEMEQAQNVFANPALLPISQKGSSGLGRMVPLAGTLGAAGYLAGANSGLGQGGAGVGAFLGGGLGAFLGGPAAIRRYVQMQRAATGQLDAVRDLGLAPNRIINPWIMMEQGVE